MISVQELFDQMQTLNNDELVEYLLELCWKILDQPDGTYSEDVINICLLELCWKILDQPDGTYSEDAIKTCWDIIEADAEADAEVAAEIQSERSQMGL